MSISMKQLGARFEMAAKRVEPVSERQLAALAQVGVGYVKSEIQSMHAVDTGAMLNSTEAEKLDPKTYVIGPTVQYAPYVALGTSRMLARPFHIVAAKKLQRNAKKLFDAGDLGL
jgi:hypothetical protein